MNTRFASISLSPKRLHVAEPTRLLSGASGSRIASYDAIRGLAIALVMLRHAFPGAFGGGGFVGVEVFFVLSGFLITSIVRGQQARGSFSFRRFYRNRLLRLAPGLAALVTAMTALELFQKGDPGRTLGAAAVALAYLADFALAFDLPQLSHLNHLWTLAIEEQFYLVWPAVFVLLLRRGASLARVAAISVAVGAVALVLSTALINRPDPLYVLPSTWAVALLSGCALSLVPLPTVTSRTAWAAVGVLVLVGVVPEAKNHLAAYLVAIPLVVIAASGLIVNASGQAPIRLLRSRPLQGLGVISYGAYLWNVPASQTLPGLVSAPATIAAAILSYVFVERVFLRLKT